MCASGARRICGNGQSQALSSDLGEHAHRHPAAPARCRAWQKQQRARLGPLSAITRPLTMESLAQCPGLSPNCLPCCEGSLAQAQQAYQTHAFPLGLSRLTYSKTAVVFRTVKLASVRVKWSAARQGDPDR